MLKARTFHRDSLLSPYTYHEVQFQGNVYRSAYHLYQAMKYLERRPELAEHIRQCERQRDLEKLVDSLGSDANVGLKVGWNRRASVSKQFPALTIRGNNF